MSNRQGSFYDYSDNRKWTKDGKLEVQTGGLLSNFWSFQIAGNLKWKKCRLYMKSKIIFFH